MAPAGGSTQPQVGFADLGVGHPSPSSATSLCLDLPKISSRTWHMLLCLQISHFHPVLPGGWVTKTTHLCSMQNLAPVPKSYPTSTESHQHGACAGSKPINQKPEQILFFFPYHPFHGYNSFWAWSFPGGSGSSQSDVGFPPLKYLSD